MKISVITICKNEKDTIEETLLSILDQTYRNFEIIVVDGVSTDGTIDVIEKYSDKISHFISEPDTGIYNAMNKGIKIATGDLLYFLNANDTIYDENVFKKIIKAFKKNPDIMLSFGNAYYVNRQNNTKYLFDYTKLYDSYFLFYKLNLFHQTMFYRKELFEKYGLYDENYIIAGDADKNMKFLLEQKVKAMYLPFVVANYAMNGISSSLKMKKIIQKEGNRNYRKYYYNNFFYRSIFNLEKLFKYFLPKWYLLYQKTSLYKNFVKKNKMNVEMITVV